MPGGPWPYDRRIPFLFWGHAFVRLGHVRRARDVAGHGDDPGRAAQCPMPGTASVGASGRSEGPDQGYGWSCSLFSTELAPIFRPPSAILPVLGQSPTGRMVPGRALQSAAVDHQHRPRVPRRGRRPPVPRHRRRRLVRRGRRPAADLGGPLAAYLMALTLADVWNTQTEGVRSSSARAVSPEPPCRSPATAITSWTLVQSSRWLRRGGGRWGTGADSIGGPST